VTEPAREPEIPERTWRRIYVVVVVYGLLTLVALWWLTRAYDV
jgi:hypothetical protein